MPAVETNPAAALGLVTAGNRLLDARRVDVGRSREASRRSRLWRLSVLLGVPAAFLWWRIAQGSPIDLLQAPHIDWLVAGPLLFFVLLTVVLLGSQAMAGRSPHVLYRTEQLDVGLDDVVGVDELREEAIRSINLLLAHRTFADEMGGTPRRGLLFEGAPGTGKTHLAKAMAKEAGVPFLFVSATAFQSMFYGATARKIRSYFKALRKAARREGGAIGFIEEIDAIATTRGGMGMTASPAVWTHAQPYAVGCHQSSPMAPVIARSVTSEGTGGVVNELLVQMQSFDAPTATERLRGAAIEAVNLLLPTHRQLRKPKTVPANVMVIAASNRADALDPALMRPGRFDKRLTFELPAKAARRQLVDHFLAGKAHTAELDDPERRDALAAVTQGCSPVMLEHLLDEALVSALRDGRTAMTWRDVESARLTESVGMGQPVAYTEHERRLIATHEAGHTVVAWLTMPQRRLEIVSIIKRRGALGMLAHGDSEDVYTRSRTEMLGLIRIAMGGQAAEEVFFNDVSTGPAGDLHYATTVAADMVGSAGMTGTLVSMAAVQGGALTETNVVGRVLADEASRARVEDLLAEQKRMAVRIVTAHRHLVEALRDALVERHELVGHEITDVLEAAAQRARETRRTIDLRDAADAGLDH